MTALRGRQAEAVRNDSLILDAAREVFLADPGAPVSAVGARAGVGMAALYRRYPSKEVLLRELARDGLQRFTDDVERALAERGDRWQSYCTCLRRVLDGRSQALAQRLAGTFTPTPELDELARHSGAQYEKLHRRTQRAGALRRDVSSADVVLLLEMLAIVDLPGADGAALRRRYLELLLHSLEADPRNERLPGRPAVGSDLAARWRSP